MDAWLQQTLSHLQRLRRSVVGQGETNNVVQNVKTEESLAQDQQRLIQTLGKFVVDYQDIFQDLWDGQCAPLVFWATRLLWCSATVAVVLTAYMFWIYLADLSYNRDDQYHFAIITIVGLAAPGFYFARKIRCKRHTPRRGARSSLGRTRFTDLLGGDTTPLRTSSFRSQSTVHSCTGQVSP